MSRAALILPDLYIVRARHILSLAATASSQTAKWHLAPSRAAARDVWMGLSNGMCGNRKCRKSRVLVCRLFLQAFWLREAPSEGCEACCDRAIEERVIAFPCFFSAGRQRWANEGPKETLLQQPQIRPCKVGFV